MAALLREFHGFLLEEKRWWLVPLVVVLAAMGLLVILTTAVPAIAPFIYPVA